MSPSFTLAIEWDNIRLASSDRARRMLRELRRQIGTLSAEARPEILLLYDPRGVERSLVDEIVGSELKPDDLAAEARVVPAPGYGYYQQKNLAAREASRELMVFLDCDVVPEPDWLTTITEPFADPAVKIVAGATYLECYSSYSKATALYWNYPVRSEGEGLRPTDSFHANNLAVRRDFLRRHPFPDASTYRVQCVLLRQQLLARGVPILLQRSARVAHPPPNGFRHFVLAALHDGRDDVFVAAAANRVKHPRRWLRIRSSYRWHLGEIMRKIRTHRRDIRASASETALAVALGFAYYSIKATASAVTLYDRDLLRRWFPFEVTPPETIAKTASGGSAVTAALASAPRPPRLSDDLSHARLLFITGHAFLPEREGGSERAIHELAGALMRHGATVAVHAATSGDWQDWRQPGHRAASYWGYNDTALGYEVFRRRDPIGTIGSSIDEFRPTQVIVQAGAPFSAARAALAVGAATLVYLRDVEFGELYAAADAAEPLDLHHPQLRFLANSHFTAERYRQAFGIDATVVPPLVDPDTYRVESSREQALFVSPVAQKGVEIVLQLAAARPDIPFRIVEGWPLTATEYAALETRCRALGNVTLSRNLADMRTAYARARLLLVPSQWEEAWARVVTEAQISGIPVLASDRGGLPESLGPGGMVVGYDSPIENWIAALGRLWDEPDFYARCVEAARSHAARAEIQPEALLARFVRALGEIGNASHGRSTSPRRRIDDIGLSIVIPTYRRPKDLDWMLARLRPQVEGFPARQIIVVNDGSHDEAYARVIERYRNMVDYIVAPANRGPAAARNLGAIKAELSYLVFLDDDCEPPDYWLDWLCAIIAENPDADVIGGSTRPNVIERPRWFQRFLATARFLPGPAIRDGRPLLVASANMAVRRTTFVHIGGFDETMRTTEDRNLTYRLRRAGAIFHIDPAWFVYHDLTNAPLAHFHRYYHYGVGNGRQVPAEGDAPDRDSWPIKQRSWRYWLERLPQEFRRAQQHHRFRDQAWITRRLYMLLSALTFLVMDLGYVAGLREPPPKT